MNVVNTNISSLRATNASVQAGRMLGTSMERLSTGRRINSAADDAAGLAIAASFTSQIRGMAQGVRNANDGISLAQTAEGALDEVTNMLQRMRELTVQRSNETYSTTDIANIDSERDALASQINSVIENTTFNGINLFSTATNEITIQAGAEAVDAVAVTLPDLEQAATLTAVVTFGATPAAVAGATLDQYDAAIGEVTTARADLGAFQNRLQSAVNNHHQLPPSDHTWHRMRGARVADRWDTDSLARKQTQLRQGRSPLARPRPRCCAHGQPVAARMCCRC